MSTLFKNKFNIDSTRLQTWDYSNPSWYYITINTKKHQECFGVIKNDKMVLNAVGRIAEKHWLEMPDHYPSVKLDYYVIMPNHIHGILILNDVETGHAPSLQSNIIRKPSLGNVIGNFKSAVTKWCNKNGFSSFSWQSRFYDRIVRNEKELYQIRKYIAQNPLKWDVEKNVPENINTNIL